MLFFPLLLSLMYLSDSHSALKKMQLQKTESMWPSCVAVYVE